ncbi:hypothetical protein LIER_08965 [Lithospermum erythrorhizon]|uniref:Uncharacterized protein n=1 Tax=Lithospermum erythrorhizon TaxID=34254 RepID=A0AAV3PEZ1_LITER
MLCKAEILCKAKDITMKYNMLCKAESEFYRNKAMMAWYKDGDDNTKLFHSSTRINQSKSLITQIHNDEGVLITDYQQVQVVAIEFYKKLFSVQDSVGKIYGKFVHKYEQRHTTHSKCI